MSIFNNSQRSLMDNSRDMDSLINRVNLLKREHESMVRRNLATLNKTEKILTIKKDKSNFKEKLQQIKQTSTNTDKMKVKKNENMTQDYYAQKQQQLQLLRQQKNQNFVRLQEQRMNALKQKKLKHDLILMKQTQAKLNFDNYWQNKIAYYQHVNTQNKLFEAKQRQIKDQSIINLEKIEMNLINQLQDTSQCTMALNKQLQDALLLPHQEFKNKYTSEDRYNIQKHLNSSVFRSQFVNTQLPLINENSQYVSRDQFRLKQQHKNIQKIYSTSVKIVPTKKRKVHLQQLQKGQNLDEYLQSQSNSCFPETSQPIKSINETEQDTNKGSHPEYKKTIEEEQRNSYTEEEDNNSQSNAPYVQMKNFSFPKKNDENEENEENNEENEEKSKSEKIEESKYEKSEYEIEQNEKQRQDIKIDDEQEQEIEIEKQEQQIYQNEQEEEVIDNEEYSVEEFEG